MQIDSMIPIVVTEILKGVERAAQNGVQCWPPKQIEFTVAKGNPLTGKALIRFAVERPDSAAIWAANERSMTLK